MVQRKPNATCTVCATAIYRRPAQLKSGAVFCSLLCSAQSQQIPKQCPVCNTTYTGAKRTCSRACANIARTGITYTKHNTFNNAYQGRLLKEKIAQKRGGVCERCRHSNYTILQVHHKIERYRGGTDALVNLELLCPNCHTAHHLGQSALAHK